MLSIDSEFYKLPVAQKRQDGGVAWVVQSKRGPERLVSPELTYTLLPGYVWADGSYVDDRLSFIYMPNGNVKATGRTLRKYGAANVAKMINMLFGWKIGQDTDSEKKGAVRDAQPKSARGKADLIEEFFGLKKD